MHAARQRFSHKREAGWSRSRPTNVLVGDDASTAGDDLIETPAPPLLKHPQRRSAEWRRSAIERNRTPPRGRARRDLAQRGHRLEDGARQPARAARAHVATLIAPTGYGKTTLLEQWAERDERQFTWLFLGPRDDPVAPLSQIEAAYNCTLGAGRRRGRRRPPARPGDRAALSELLRPACARRDGRPCWVHGAAPPALSIPRLRASGELLELGPTDLALTRRETRTMARGAGRDPDGSAVRRSGRRDRGLARCRPTRACLHVDTRACKSTCLAALTPTQRTFLRRTSLLDRLSPPLCDAVLGYEPGEARTRSRRTSWAPFRIARSRPPVVPLPASSSSVGSGASWRRPSRSWFRSSTSGRRCGTRSTAISPAYWCTPTPPVTSPATSRTSLSRPSPRTTRGRTPTSRLGSAASEQPTSSSTTRKPRRSPPGYTRTTAGRRRQHLSPCSRSRPGPHPVEYSRPDHDPGAGEARADSHGRNAATDMLVGAQAALEQLSSTDRWHAYGLLLEGVAYVLLGEDDARRRRSRPGGQGGRAPGSDRDAGAGPHRTFAARRRAG